MKKTLLFISLILISLPIIGQYVIINDSIEGGSNIPFQDTTIWTDNWTDIEYFIDLDQDSIYDVRFEIYNIWGGTWGEYHTAISAFNDFTFHVDTNYLDYTLWHYNDTTIVADTITRTVVKEYSSGDTIYNNQISTSANTYISFYKYQSSGVYTVNGNVNHFIDDTSYIAFTKNTGQSTFIYYIRIYMYSYAYFHLFNAKSNEVIISGVNDNLVPSNIIYPNPVSEKIYFERNFSYYEIFTLQGTLIQSGRINENQRVIEVSGIPRGYYILKFRDKNTEFVTKFIKS